MGYLFTVLTLINLAAILAVGYYLRGMYLDLPGMVETVIQSEVKKQDDRIEKRLSRAEGPREDTVETPGDGRLTVGQPFRR